MIMNPERYMGAVCLVTFAVSAMFATIEWWQGLGPGSRQKPGAGPNVQKDENDRHRA